MNENQNEPQGSNDNIHNKNTEQNLASRQLTLIGTFSSVLNCKNYKYCWLKFIIFFSRQKKITQLNQNIHYF